jgi:hypothetical protein
MSTYHSTQSVMLLATVAGCLGSILYIGAPLAASGQHSVLVGRFLQGLWTGGAQAVQQTHLAKVLPVAELTAATVTLNAFGAFWIAWRANFFTSCPAASLTGGNNSL